LATSSAIWQTRQVEFAVASFGVFSDEWFENIQDRAVCRQLRRFLGIGNFEIVSITELARLSYKMFILSGFSPFIRSSSTNKRVCSGQ
jgi:hypothetical protein